jgi:hypothetical protein
MEFEWAALCEDAKQRDFGTADLIDAGSRFIYPDALPARSEVCLAIQVSAQERELDREARLDIKLGDADMNEMAISDWFTFHVRRPENPNRRPPGGVVRVFNIVRFDLTVTREGPNSPGALR